MLLPFSDGVRGTCGPSDSLRPLAGGHDGWSHIPSGTGGCVPRTQHSLTRKHALLHALNLIVASYINKQAGGHSRLSENQGSSSVIQQSVHPVAG